MMDLTPYRRDKQFLIQEIINAGGEVLKEGREVRCPFHDDKNPSSGVYQDEESNWKFTCHAHGCGFSGDVFDVIAKASGKDCNDVLSEFSKQDGARPKPQPSPEAKQIRIYRTIEELERVVEWSDKDEGGKIAARYQYTNPETFKVDMIVFRLERPQGHKKRKTFRQAHAIDGGYTLTAPKGKHPLYNRIRVKDAETVVVVEGEKCVHALNDLKIVATTSPGGSNSAELADWSPLSGKRVILWPDNDDIDIKTGLRSGIEYMRKVAALLMELPDPPSIHWISPEDLDLPEGGDCVDYIAGLKTQIKSEQRSAVDVILETAEPIGCAQGVIEQIQDAIAGRRKAIPFPWPILSRATRAMLPGTVTILAGPAGATKSFFLLYAIIHWWSEGIPVAVMELEEDRDYHLRRALAIRAQLSNLCDDEWCEKNPDKASAIAKEFADFMNRFGPCISWFESGEIKSDKLLSWLESKLVAGCRIVAIDPITAMDGGKDSWLNDLRFMFKAKALVRKHKASLILVTHPRKGAQNKGMGDIAGGACYERFSQVFLFFQHLKRDKEENFKCATVIVKRIYNRIMKIWKTRNSYGAGTDIAFTFSGKTFKSDEVGVLGECDDPE